MSARPSLAGEKADAREDRGRRPGRRRAAVLAILLAFAGAPAARGREGVASEPAALEAVLAPILARAPVPALGGAVFTRDGLVAIGAVGRRRADDETAVTRDDLWHLGSCTKSMTATLLARLEARGSIHEADTLATCFDGMEVHEALRGVTLERLMAHRAGLPAAYPRDLWAWCWRAETDGRGQRVRMAERMLASPPDHDAGTYVYANMDFDLVGAAIERRLDAPFERLLEREVFAPLGIHGAGFGAPGRPDALTQPRGHRPGPDPVPVEPGPGADNPLVLSPAGRVHMSLADWARYLALHLGPPPGAPPPAGGAPPPFLSAEDLARLHATAEGETYGHGWIVTHRPWAQGPVLTHAGSNTMWYAVAWLAPGSGFGVCATTNVGGDEAAKACDEVAGALIRWWRER